MREHFGGGAVPKPEPVYRTKAWQVARAQVIARDRGICQMCGLAGGDSVDHIVPWREGGAWYDLENLRLVHRRCNSSRVSRPQRAGKADRRPSREW